MFHPVSPPFARRFAQGFNEIIQRLLRVIYRRTGIRDKNDWFSIHAF